MKIPEELRILHKRYMLTRNKVGTVQTVYRMQNRKGKGPYVRSTLPWTILAAHNLCEQHPNPFSDHGINRACERNERCGFLSLHYLLNWFNKEEVQALEARGFYITPVLGTVTAVGKYQILFKKLRKTRKDKKV